ncbi:MAG: hypothetical protein ACXVB5_15330, partial [Isosphaeraceae bacterium]
APSPRQPGGRDRASLMTLGITFRKRRTEKGPAAMSRRPAWRRGRWLDDDPRAGRRRSRR